MVNMPIFGLSQIQNRLKFIIPLVCLRLRIEVKELTINIPVLSWMLFHKTSFLQLFKQNPMLFEKGKMLPKTISSTENRYFDLRAWVSKSIGKHHGPRVFWRRYFTIRCHSRTRAYQHWMVVDDCLCGLYKFILACCRHILIFNKN